MAKLGDVCTIVSGTTPKSNCPEYWDGGINWVTPAELNDDSDVIYESQRKITEQAVQDSSLKPFPAGTVLLSSRAPIGKVAIAGVEMYCNQGFKNLICSNRIYNRYLYHFLKNSTEYLNSLGRGATFKEISKSIVENIEIPLPPLDEQRRIAAVLDKVSDLIAKRREQLDKLDELVKARFVEMFGDFNSSRTLWSTSKFGEEFSITSGGTPATGEPAYWENGNISWIGSNLCQDVILYENDGKFITQSGLDHSSAKVFKSGTVLVALVGATIGKTALLRFDTATNQNVAAINVPENSQFCSEFIFYELQMLYWKFQEIGNGKFKMANQRFIRELPTMCPPLELQRQFADIVGKVVKSKLTIQQSLDKLEVMKKALMQQYFG